MEYQTSLHVSFLFLISLQTACLLFSRHWVVLAFFKGFRAGSLLWNSEIRRIFLGGPYIKDYSILGSILGSPYFGKILVQDFRTARADRLIDLLPDFGEQHATQLHPGTSFTDG